LHSRFRHSIGTKLLLAFLAMGAIIALVGAYGYSVLVSAGDMVISTYDGPLQAISYARAASVDFVEMQKTVLLERAAAAQARPAFARKIDDLTSTFFDDLDVAEQRLDAGDERAIVRQIRGLVGAWQQSHQAGHAAELDRIGDRVLDRFDMLVELNADHSFVGRRKAVWAIGYFKYALLGVTALALLLAFVITLLLARRIMRPLRAAVAAADRIAEGEFETAIPQAEQDETGVLLNSMTVMQDNIREMVAREKARAESAEARLAHALATSSEGVVLVGADGRILLANNRVGEFFPTLAGRLETGMDFSEAARIAERELEDADAIPAAKIAGDRKPRLLGPREARLRDGRWIRLSGSRTDDGCLILFVSDFSAVKEREENAQRARATAESASAAKSRFLTNMSHELRTPLNAIIGFSEMMAGEVFGALGNPRYAGYAADIGRSGRHLLDIINSVLEITRSEIGRQTLVSEPVDLRFVLADCGKMLAARCGEAGISFALQAGTDAVIVPGEKAKLRQIFLNLLSNAVKFTESGGRVDVTLARHDDLVEVEVADTGIGMSPEDIAVALTPFAQVDSRLARKYEGIGLGLPLAKSLVELHGGRLEIGSTPGNGTKVRVFLPTAEIASSVAPAAIEA
jgi:signal transduction histidine kinase/HAMP domain-containing protein